MWEKERERRERERGGGVIKGSAINSARRFK